ARRNRPLPNGRTRAAAAGRSTLPPARAPAPGRVERARAPWRTHSATRDREQYRSRACVECTDSLVELTPGQRVAAGGFRSHASDMARSGVGVLLLALCVALTPAMATGQTSSEPDAGWVEDSAPEEQWEEEPPGELAPAFDEYDADPRALSEFRPVLDAYGYWVQDARYGLVWVPDRSIVGADFA